jgi:hypothetical protein
VLVWSVAGWCQVSLPSQARELACKAADWWAKASIWSRIYQRERKGHSYSSAVEAETTSLLLRWRLGHLWTFQLWVWVRVRWTLFIGRGFAAFLRWSGLFVPYSGRGNNLGSILLISPVADLSDPASLLQDAEM